MSVITVKSAKLQTVLQRFLPQYVQKTHLHLTPVCQKTQAGKYKGTPKRNFPLTYEMANPPYQIAHRKSWNSWNTSAPNFNAERSINTRLTNARDAKRGEFPHQVSLQYFHEETQPFWMHKCGGAIVSKTWVVTAGHCLYQKQGTFQIFAGWFKMFSNPEDAQVRIPVETLVHPKYYGGIGAHDIGLLRVDVPFDFSDTVQAIKLPNAEQVFSGEVAISGWGSVSQMPNADFPDKLQAAELQLISDEECEEALDTVGGGLAWLLDYDAMVCTGATQSQISGCSGDSGSALVQKDQIVGVLTFGVKPCGLPYAPSAYTDVSRYLDFLLEHVKNA